MQVIAPRSKTDFGYTAERALTSELFKITCRLHTTYLGTLVTDQPVAMVARAVAVAESPFLHENILFPKRQNYMRRRLHMH